MDDFTTSLDASSCFGRIVGYSELIVGLTTAR
jgi:hypothetical protein